MILLNLNIPIEYLNIPTEFTICPYLGMDITENGL